MTLGVMQNFGIFPAVFDGLTINHMLSLGFSTNIQQLISRAGGSVDPALIAEIARENEIRLTTGDIGTVLGSVSPTNGLAVTTSGEIQYQKRQSGGVFTTSSEHVTLNSTKGMLIPRTINSSQDSQEAATLELSYIPLRVGTNAPFIVNVNQSLTGVPGVNTLYKQGPIVFEDTTLFDIQDSTTDFGITFEHWRGSGATAAADGSITKREPKMEFTGRNLELLNSIGGGLVGMTEGITQYYRQIGYTDNAGAHIAISFSAGTYEISDVSGQGQNSVDQKVTVMGTGTISVTVGASIPTS
ncbi:hypothetical protein Enr10x_21090 [Gimesia panareensis]|uniref:Uncharacterized protein n=1 Tax=Gimesia panareensis TaxID=2527978 RepID=A0A517Q5A0_9PLAN|nr:hypothetical protein [Gimesia panareensis]QDT26799.1 hypothetical protein Enr10x_21090 [Gimesia panareensis]